MLVTRARDTSWYLAFCNLVGGQDELVFDGHSVVLDDRARSSRAPPVSRRPARRRRRAGGGDGPAAARHPSAIARPVAGQSLRGDVVEFAAPPGRRARAAQATVEPFEPELEQMRRVDDGLRDYADKNGFKEVVIGVRVASTRR